MRGFNHSDDVPHGSFNYDCTTSEIFSATQKIPEFSPLPQCGKTRRARPGLLAAILCLAVAAAPCQAGEIPVPRRIVSLVPAITETLFAVGAGKQVLAVSRYCNFPREAATRPKVGSFLVPAVEAVIALEPDLVLISPSPGNLSAVETLRRAGVRVEVVPEGSASISEALATMERVADLARHHDEGRRLVAGIRARIDAVRARVRGRPRPRGVVVVGRQPLILAGPDSYLGELLETAGADNLARSVGGKWPRTSLEFLLSASPEVIIDASMDGGSERPDGERVLARWRRYSSLPAVAAGRVFAAGDDLFLRPGPRLGAAAEALARWIHPETNGAAD